MENPSPDLDSDPLVFSEEICPQNTQKGAAPAEVKILGTCGLAVWPFTPL